MKKVNPQAPKLCCEFPFHNKIVNSHNLTHVSMVKAVPTGGETKCVELLDSEQATHCPHVQVVGKTTNSAEGIHLIHGLQPDLVFLDIEIPQINGFQLLKRGDEIFFQLIFVTAYNEFAVIAEKSLIAGIFPNNSPIFPRWASNAMESGYVFLRTPSVCSSSKYQSYWSVSLSFVFTMERHYSASFLNSSNPSHSRPIKFLGTFQPVNPGACEKIAHKLVRHYLAIIR